MPKTSGKAGAPQIASIKALPPISSFMFLRFGTVTAVTLILVLAIAIATTTSSGQATVGVIREQLLEQVLRHVARASLGLADTVSTQLQRIEHSTVRFCAAHHEQALASSTSPVAGTNAFLDDANFTLAPVIDDATFAQAVTELIPGRGRLQRVGKRSVWYVPPIELAASGGTPLAHTEFVRKQSSTFDHFVADILTENDKVATLYAGFTAQGLFRTAPGHNITLSFPDYDPRLRGWYKAAEAAQAPIYSDPYIDAGGRGWMITVASPIWTYAHNGSTGPMQGVVGADVTVGTIQNQVKGTRVFDRAAAHLLTMGGRVVASGEFDAVRTAAAAYADGSRVALNQAAPFGYDTLDFLSRELWEELSTETDSGVDATAIQRDVGGTPMVIGRAFIRDRPVMSGVESQQEQQQQPQQQQQAGANGSALSAGLPHFVVLVAVKEEVALDPLVLITLQISSSVGNIVALSVGGVALMFTIIAFVVVRTVRVMTRPLESLVNLAESLATLPQSSMSTSMSTMSTMSMGLTATTQHTTSLITRRRNTSATTVSPAAGARGSSGLRRVGSMRGRSAMSGRGVPRASAAAGSDSMTRSTTQGRGVLGLIGASPLRLDGYLLSDELDEISNQHIDKRDAEAAAAAWSDWCVTKCCCFCCCCSEAELGDTAGGAEEITSFIRAFKRMLTGVNRPAAAASSDAERPRLNPFWTTNTLTDEGTAQPIRVSERVLVVPSGYRLRGGDRSVIESDGRSVRREGSRRVDEGPGGGDGIDALGPEAGWDSLEHSDDFHTDDATALGERAVRDMTRKRQSSVESDPAHAPGRRQSHEVEQSEGTTSHTHSRSGAHAAVAEACGTASESTTSALATATAPVLPSTGSAASSTDSAMLGPASETSEEGIASGGGRAIAGTGRGRARPGLLVSDVTEGSALPNVTDGTFQMGHGAMHEGADVGDDAMAGYELVWQRQMRAAGIPYGNPRPCGEFYDE